MLDCRRVEVDEFYELLNSTGRSWFPPTADAFVRNSFPSGLVGRPAKHRVSWLSGFAQFVTTRGRGRLSRTLLNLSDIHTKFSCSQILWAAKLSDKVYDFHVELGIPTKRRSIRKDDAWYWLYCFANPNHAKLFRVYVRRRTHSGANRRSDRLVYFWSPCTCFSRSSSGSTCFYRCNDALVPRHNHH